MPIARASSREIIEHQRLEDVDHIATLHERDRSRRICPSRGSQIYGYVIHLMLSFRIKIWKYLKFIISYRPAIRLAYLTLLNSTKAQIWHNCHSLWSCSFCNVCSLIFALFYNPMPFYPFFFTQWRYINFACCDIQLTYTVFFRNWAWIFGSGSSANP